MPGALPHVSLSYQKRPPQGTPHLFLIPIFTSLVRVPKLNENLLENTWTEWNEGMQLHLIKFIIPFLIALSFGVYD